MFKGNIYLNGVSYQDLSADNIREQLGLVTQEAVIFSTTIYPINLFKIEKSLNHLSVLL